MFTEHSVFSGFSITLLNFASVPVASVFSSLMSSIFCSSESVETLSFYSIPISEVILSEVSELTGVLQATQDISNNNIGITTNIFFILFLSCISSIHILIYYIWYYMTNVIIFQYLRAKLFSRTKMVSYVV